MNGCNNAGAPARLPLSDVYEALPFKILETRASLHALGVRAVANPLEAILGVSTDAPDRGVATGR